MKDLLEERIETNRLYTGNIINLRRDKVRLPNGREASREVVEHPGAVAIVPINAAGKVVLVRQYRYPTGRTLLEIPAGKLEKGEDPAACAARELEEETGFTAGRLKKLVSFFTTPGFSDEILHVYLAKELCQTAQNLDADEFVEVEAYSFSELKAMIANNAINDAKTLVGLLMAEQYHD